MGASPRGKRKTGGRRVDSPVGVPSGVHVVVGDVDGGVSGEVARVRDRPVGRVAEPVDADSTKVGEAARAEVKLRDSKRTRLHLYTKHTRRQSNCHKTLTRIKINVPCASTAGCSYRRLGWAAPNAGRRRA